ncbi:MAG: hypothetical protein WAV20_18315 [Blastocatellia bacterium]
MMQIGVVRRVYQRQTSGSDEKGWALLGLLLALGVMSIVLASSIVPNVQMQVQREKEAEMIYRGEQMGLGIARYYGRGNLLPLQLQSVISPALGRLGELSKLREGATIGVREIKFVRPSAMIDPLSNSEWEPVRVRDPRLMKFLQAWAAQTLIPIPNDYLTFASVPQNSVFNTPGSPSDKMPGSPGSDRPPAVDPERPTPPNPVNPGNPQVRPPARPADEEDDDDDDDDTGNDPLAHLLESTGPGQSNAPIIGVAPKRKGKATTAYFGLENYEDWVFLYVPKTIQVAPGRPGQAPRPPRISQ